MLCIFDRKYVLMALLLGGCAAQAAVLECPVNAPADWKLPKSRLDRARVLGYPPTTRQDERGLAEGLPDREWRVGSTLYQSWNMKAARRSMIYQVDCLYTGTRRVVRFDARSTARCVARRRVEGEALVSGSMAFRCR